MIGTLTTGKIVAIILGLAVVAGGGYAVATGKIGGGMRSETNLEVREEQGISSSGSGSLRSLLSLGEEVKCTVSFTPEGTEMKVDGTFYVSGKLMRGDFTMVQQGMNMTSHMINDGAMLYTWSETPAGTMGAKFAIDANENTTAGGPNPSDNFNLDQSVAYNCEHYHPEVELFTPPSTVEFRDVTSSIPTSVNANVNAEVQGQVQAGAAAQCGMCDQIPDANAKAQCKATLKCN